MTTRRKTNLWEKLQTLQMRYAKTQSYHRASEPIAKEMQKVVLKQLKREIREDKNAQKCA